MNNCWLGQSAKVLSLQNIPDEMWWGSRAVFTMTAYVATMVRLFALEFEVSPPVGRAIIGAALSSGGLIVLLASAALLGEDTQTARWLGLLAATTGLIMASVGVAVTFSSAVDAGIAPFTWASFLSISLFGVLLTMLNFDRAYTGMQGP
jgi:hypothetical protein